MSAPRNRTVGEAIYSSIDTNEYLLKLYNELLKAYINKWKSILKSDVPKLNNLFKKIISLNNKKINLKLLINLIFFGYSLWVLWYYIKI